MQAIALPIKCPFCLEKVFFYKSIKDKIPHIVDNIAAEVKGHPCSLIREDSFWQSKLLQKYLNFEWQKNHSSQLPEFASLPFSKLEGRIKSSYGVIKSCSDINKYLSIELLLNEHTVITARTLKSETSYFAGMAIKFDKVIHNKMQNITINKIIEAKISIDNKTMFQHVYRILLECKDPRLLEKEEYRLIKTIQKSANILNAFPTAMKGKNYYSVIQVYSKKGFSNLLTNYSLPKSLFIKCEHFPLSK